MVRPLVALAFVVAFLGSAAHADPDGGAIPDNASVSSFLDDLWSDAQQRGVTRATFDLALAGFAPGARIVAATRREPEYGKPVGAYVSSAVSPARIAGGAA